MSHFTHITTQIRDIAALREACKELGLEILHKTDARGYAGNSTAGEYVIRLKGPYDVALNRDGNAYQLTADLWAGHVERELGDNYSRLKQLYGIHKASLEARRKGLSVRRQPLKNGKVRLTLTALGAA